MTVVRTAGMVAATGLCIAIAALAWPVVVAVIQSRMGGA